MVKEGFVPRAVAIVGVLLGSSAAAIAAHLSSETATGWNVYVRATEARIAAELRAPSGFLALDFQSDAASTRRTLLAGEVVVRAMEASRSNGRPAEVPSARVEHWLGAILIPGITAARLVDELEKGPPPSDDVLKSSVLDRGPDWMLVSMRLQRKAIVTVVYDTEHIVTFTRRAPSRATSTSTAIRIVEIAEANTPQEHQVRADNDRGFLWRLNAYWRYQDVAGGVVAECESVTLSRDVPSVVRFLVNPIIERTARESMTRTLAALRTRFGTTYR
jgi:hypothetical protein